MAFRQNHYVPIWYQKRFLRNSPQQELYFLDLDPPIFRNRDGIVRVALTGRRKPTAHCFVEKDLYTTFFGREHSTQIEQRFFGNIDRKAPILMDALENFKHPLSVDPKLLLEAISILSVQKLRTPKGLINLSEILKTKEKNTILYEMQRLKNLYCAIWTESVWQIADASKAETKFILSDHPVTIYNRACYPGSADCGSTSDPDIRNFGSHTIFPLSSEKILILTNLSYVRDPFGNPMRMRPNPQMLRTAVFNALDIQTERFLTDTEVVTINYVIKKRAYKYIAAGKSEWLYPERTLKVRGWFNLGEGDIFMPDPRGVSFNTGIYVGYNERISDAFDPYGHRPGQRGYADKRLQEKEWITFSAAKAAFAKKHGPKRRGRSCHMVGLEPEFDSESLHKSHLKGLDSLNKIKVWHRK